jgi:hypothetical protein
MENGDSLAQLDREDFLAVWNAWVAAGDTERPLVVEVSDYETVIIGSPTPEMVAFHTQWQIQDVTEKDIDRMAEESTLVSTVNKWVASMASVCCEQDDCAESGKQEVDERSCGHYSCLACWKNHCTVCADEEAWMLAGSDDDCDNDDTTVANAAGKKVHVITQTDTSALRQKLADAKKATARPSNIKLLLLASPSGGAMGNKPVKRAKVSTVSAKTQPKKRKQPKHDKTAAKKYEAEMRRQNGGSTRRKKKK